MRRIAVDVFLLIAAFLLPWWATIALAAAAALVFARFYEIIFIGIIIDSLYSTPVAEFYRFQFAVTLLAIIVLVATEFLKSRLKFYR